MSVHGVRRRTRTFRTRVAGPVILALAASLLGAPVAQAGQAGQAQAEADFSKVWKPPHRPLPGTAPVKASEVRKAAAVKPRYPVPARSAERSRTPFSVPVSGSADLTGATGTAPVRAGSLPVWVSPKGAGAASSLSGEVTVVRRDDRSARELGVNGALFSLAAQTSGATRVKVGLDLAGLQAATGGEFASRGRLVTLPGCALTTPNVPSCQVRTPLTTRYDEATKRLVADVALPKAAAPAPSPAKAAASSRLLAAPAAPMLLAAETDSSGPGGTYEATALDSSQSWASGGSSGALTYQHAIQVPPALGGTAPEVGLSYDSSSVDGKTSVTNAQASWIGDGWDFNPGYIERVYKPCDKAGIPDSGDACWAGFNASLSLGSHSGSLVRDDKAGSATATTDAATGVWRLKNDDGTRIEFGSGAANGVRDGSYAKVTDSAGTTYYFGVNHLPGGDKTDPATNSVSSVPVYSPKSGQPCYDSAKGTGSWCQMWQRLSLDHVVDAHGNLTTYKWAPETNWYKRGAGQNNGNGTMTEYTRATTLASIAYGQKLSEQVAAKGALQPAAKVNFTVTERCTAAGTACEPANRTVANKANWPDVPVDNECKSTGTCVYYAATYFTTKRLTRIATQVRVGNAWQDVDTYDLVQSFPDPKDAGSQRALWLDSVRRTGRTATPHADLPAVSFTPVMLPNRVDGTNLVPAPPIMNRPRIQQIHNETGGVLNVDYNLPDCSRINNVMPTAEDDNNRACYPVRWSPPGSVVDSDPVLDWFHHYTVKSLTETDTATDTPQKITDYAYGSAAWHRDDSELTEAKSRTWGDFRGFANVTTTVGSGTDGPRSQSVTTYRQGMDGDVRKNGTARSVHLTDALGRDVTDVDWLSGQVLQTEAHHQAGGTVATQTVHASDDPVATATHTRTGLPALVARYTGTRNTTTTRVKLADGTWRTSTATQVTDPARNNRTVTSLEQADGVPDECTRTSYASGPDAQRTGLVSEALKVSGPDACTADPTATNTVSRARTFYDGLAHGQAGATGDATKSEILDRYATDGSPVFVTASTTGYDGYGRVTSLTDPNSKDAQHPNGTTTTSVHTPAAAGELPVTVTASAPVPGQATGTWDTVTTFDPRRGLTLKTTDVNQKTTTSAYDALGRLTAVWQPGRAPESHPNADVVFGYRVSNATGVPSTVTTGKLTVDGATPVRTTSIQLMDGFGRPRQTQSTPANPAYTGRLVTDTRLDSHGREKTSNAAWYNDASGPKDVLVAAADSTVPSQKRTSYDGLDRTAVVAAWSLGTEQNRTTTSYPGADRTDVLPPKGNAPTSTITNALGHTTELWQYSTPTPTGRATDASVTRFTSTLDGEPLTRKDAAGNVWSYTYDQRGRQTSASDPDTGTTTRTYDAASRLSTLTNAKNKTLVYTYDLLGRKTGLYDGAVSAAKQLAGWTFDTAPGGRGKPATSTRYVGGSAGKAYTSAVTGYDDGARVTGTTITMPGTDAGLASGTFTYNVTTTYDRLTGNPKGTVLPALAGLPLDDIAYSYNDYGQLYKFAGATTYDTQTEYDAHGRVIRSTVNPWASQVVTTSVYDQATGRLSDQFVDKQTSLSGAVQQTGYTYDQAGRITSLTSIPDNTPAQTDRQCFTYDHLGRLTTAWSDTGGISRPDPLTHQTADQGACANTTPTAGAVAPAKTTVGGPAPYWQDYAYDLTGNRTKVVRHDPAGDTTKDATTTQTFGAPGQQNAPTSAPATGGGTGGAHALLLATTKTGTTTNNDAFQYDENGATTSYRAGKAGTSSLTWNSEGKLASLTTAAQIKGIGGKCLDAEGGSTGVGSPLQIYACNTGAGQKYSTANSTLSSGNRCVQAMGTAAGSPVTFQDCDGGADQTWTARADGTLHNPVSGRCLAVPGDVATDSLNLVLGDCATTVPAGQKWTIPNTTTTYLYDADGKLLIRRNPGTATLRLGNDELTVNTATQARTGIRYYPIPGGMTIVRTGAGTAAGAFVAQIADHHGTNNLTVDLSTLAATRSRTDAFGNVRGTAPTTWAGNKGFVGGQEDGTTGLTSLGVRMYQPSTGRFISTDPLLSPMDPQQWNGYAYANNDPVNNSDPDGRMCLHGSPGGGRDGICAGVEGDTDGVVGDYSDNCAHDSCRAAANAMTQQARKKGTYNRTPKGRVSNPKPVDNYRYSYTYSYRNYLGSATILGTPESVMKAFKENPGEVFPFPISGCDEFQGGDVCTLHPEPFPGFSPTLMGGPGVVLVTTADTSFTFEVIEEGYFDDRGSTITFSIEQKGQDLYLRQDAMTTGSKTIPTLGVLFGAAGMKWKEQTFNLQRLIVGKDLVDPLDPRIQPQNPVMEIPYGPKAAKTI
ncbi:MULTISPECIES: ricin-type beta-trefoil lectin domain protein [unclassified Streptomyces]|uniref:ricin-type beta-trefoil lectin domain protein n=1 Tax=unclassified Streptomyces TaxID=2593676 RepID=UPI001E56705C|nr:ricin-type beta-trefoil lectin domain protein [Streptomyces sp. CB02980]MCB8905999.1 ricin-type beta-trefoil lectin domain protein [Streptomyces sp. CB02980]